MVTLVREVMLVKEVEVVILVKEISIILVREVKLCQWSTYQFLFTVGKFYAAHMSVFLPLMLETFLTLNMNCRSLSTRIVTVLALTIEYH